MKKIISLVLALALLAVPFCGMSLTASAESTNLIVNGTFDDDFNGWTILDQPAGSTATGATTIHPGWNGFNATAPYACMQDYDAGFSQTLALSAGAYKLEYKYSGTGANSSFIVMVNDGKGGTPLYETTEVKNHGSFISATKLLIIEEDLEAARLRFCSENASAQVLIDDVVLTKAEISDERIVNGDFSDGATGWKALGNTLVPEGDKGAVNLRYWSNKDTGFAQDGIVLLKGEAFDFAFDSYNVGSGTRTVVARIVSGDTVIATKTVTVNSTNSKAFALRFIADATYANARVHFYAPSSEGQGTMIDNVSLKKIDTDGELVYNGQFALKDGWVGWTTSNVTITPSDSVLFWWATNPTISTEVILEKGRSYKLNYEWFSDRVHSMNVSVTMGDASLLSANWDTYATGSNFVGRSYEFTAEKTGLATLTFTTANGFNATKIRNISLVATTPNLGAERVVNGGFDTTDNWAVLWDASHIDATSDYATSTNKVGDKAIQIKNWSGGIQQDITVVKDTTYMISFLWAPCASGGSTSSMRVAIGDSYGGEYKDSYNFMYKETISSQNYNYEKYSAIFTATKTGTVALRFDRMSCASGIIALDDVSVKEISYKADFASETMSMDDNYIYGAADIDSVLSAFELSANATVECNSDVVKTGAKVTVKVEGAKLYTRELVLSGDVNGDAVCNLLDFIAVKKQASGVERLSGAFFKAACLNDDATVNADDLAVIKQTIMK